MTRWTEKWDILVSLKPPRKPVAGWDTLRLDIFEDKLFHLPFIRRAVCTGHGVVRLLDCWQHAYRETAVGIYFRINALSAQ